MPDESQLLTTSEAAEFLRLHVRTIRRMARRNDIPARRVGKQWRIPKAALIRWTEAHHIRQQSRFVLVVDDEKSLRETVRRFLEADGYRVATAENGEMALEAIRREMPDLVLLDLAMPGMRGVDVLKELHRMDSGLPVVVVTAYPDSEMMSEAMQFSPVTLLPKPVKKVAPIRTVHRVLSGSGSRRE